jgi:imidazolonepropionase-like amidohydrolase
MRRTCSFLVALLLAVTALAPAARARQKPKSRWLVFTNVTVVEVRDGTRLPGMTVVIRDDRVYAVAKQGIIQTGRGIQVVNATGKYLVTGRWEMPAGALAGLGSVELGQVADLLLLNAYPIRDLRDTQAVWAAVAAGRFLDRPALEKMLAESPPAAKPGPTSEK